MKKRFNFSKIDTTQTTCLAGELWNASMSIDYLREDATDKNKLSSIFGKLNDVLKKSLFQQNNQNDALVIRYICCT